MNDERLETIKTSYSEHCLNFCYSSVMHSCLATTNYKVFPYRVSISIQCMVKLKNFKCSPSYNWNEKKVYFIFDLSWIAERQIFKFIEVFGILCLSVFRIRNLLLPKHRYHFLFFIYDLLSVNGKFLFFEEFSDK